MPENKEVVSEAKVIVPEDKGVVSEDKGLMSEGKGSVQSGKGSVQGQHVLNSLFPPLWGNVTLCTRHLTLNQGHNSLISMWYLSTK